MRYTMVEMLGAHRSQLQGAGVGAENRPTQHRAPHWGSHRDASHRAHTHIRAQSHPSSVITNFSYMCNNTYIIQKIMDMNDKPI